jgi:hypothetical protein
VRRREAAHRLNQEVDRLLGDARSSGEGRGSLPVSDELLIAQRLSQANNRLPPVPAELERRVQAIVRSPPSPQARSWTSVVSGAVTAVVVFLLLWVVVPNGQEVGAAMMRALLGQTRVELTPTLESDVPTREVRETLRDLVAAELLMGRAPSVPRTLPEGVELQEITAVSYPDLPAWISQPFSVEQCYGTEGVPCGVRLRQYRLLFRQYGGISGFQVAGDVVTAFEQVEVSGVSGTLLTMSRQGETYTVLWERDGLLLELETDTLSKDEVLRIARSVR